MLNSQEHFHKSVCCGMVGIEIRLQYSKGRASSDGSVRECLLFETSESFFKA